MSWAARHNGVFEAMTCTWLQKAAVAKGQHFLLKIRERRHFFESAPPAGLPAGGETGAFPCMCKGALEELCYYSSAYCPWRREESVMPAKMLNFLCLGFILYWLSSRALRHKLDYQVAGPSAQPWEGIFDFQSSLLVLGFGCGGNLYWAMQTGKEIARLEWSPVWVFFSLKGSGILILILFGFLFGLF